MLNLSWKPSINSLKVYEQREIDMFKDAVSIPGISVKWKFFDLKDNNSVDIPLISTENQDLYHTVKQNIVGGPSIVFNRHHEKDVTKIREVDYGEEAKPATTYLDAMLTHSTCGP